MPEPTKTPTITSQALPPNQRPGAVDSSPAKAPPPISDADIVAKPLRAPNFVNLIPKNSSLCGRWVNRAVGEKESTMRYDQCVAMGFRPAKPEELYFLSEGKRLDCPASLARDGHVFYGDIIYMVIPRVDYVGALKWNEQTASQRVRRFGSTQATPGGTDVNAEGGRAQTESAVAGLVRGRAAQAGKIGVYIPPIAEVDGLTSGDKPTLAG